MQNTGGVLINRWSENMQQLYWRASMLKCDFSYFIYGNLTYVNFLRDIFIILVYKNIPVCTKVIYTPRTKSFYLLIDFCEHQLHILNDCW